MMHPRIHDIGYCSRYLLSTGCEQSLTIGRQLKYPYQSGKPITRLYKEFQLCNHTQASKRVQVASKQASKLKVQSCENYLKMRCREINRILYVITDKVRILILTAMQNIICIWNTNLIVQHIDGTSEIGNASA